MSDSESDDGYGPPLPPGLKSGSSSKHKENKDEDAFMPALPPHLMKASSKKEADEDSEEDDDSYGPSLPPHLQKKDTKDVEEGEEDSEDEDDMYGPALPPHLLQNKNQEKGSTQNKPRILGPSLPKGFTPPVVAAPVSEEKESSESEDDGFTVGPMPPTGEIDQEAYRIRQFEHRAKKMKDKLEGKSEDKPMQRESWMLELPEDRKSFCGLESRQFRRKAPLEKGDQSVWTDTPADKERKAKMQEQEEEPSAPEDVAAKKRDTQLSEMVDKYNTKKRAEPLIEMHQKKKKKSEAEAGPKERRPFSREEDMNVNKFDDAQKEVILKKARNLNDRFSAGNRKFL